MITVNLHLRKTLLIANPLDFHSKILGCLFIKPILGLVLILMLLWCYFGILINALKLAVNMLGSFQNPFQRLISNPFLIKVLEMTNIILEMDLRIFTFLSVNLIKFPEIRINTNFISVLLIIYHQYEYHPFSFEILKSIFHSFFQFLRTLHIYFILTITHFFIFFQFLVNLLIKIHFIGFSSFSELLENSIFC